MKTKKISIHVVSRIIALYSFAIGILILYMHFEQPNYVSEETGFIYIVFVFLLNAGLIVLLIFSVLLQTSTFKEAAKSLGILLLNIPIAIGCISFAFYINDFERITFVNATGTKITDVKFSGGYSKYIGTLSDADIFEEWIEIETGYYLNPT